MTINKHHFAETQNLRQAKKSYTLLERKVRFAIGSRDNETLNILLPFLFINAGMIIENNLYQIINSNNISDKVRKNVYSKSGLHEKWATLVKESVKENYNKNITDLPFSDRKKYEELLNFIDENINWLYKIRNKFAHGQLVEAFNNKRTEFNTEVTDKIKKLNYFDIKKTKKIFEHIMSDLLLYTASSYNAFSVQFDKYYAKFEEIQKQFNSSEYKNYVNMLQKRHDLKPKNTSSRIKI